MWVEGQRERGGAGRRVAGRSPCKTSLWESLPLRRVAWVAEIAGRVRRLATVIAVLSRSGCWLTGRRPQCLTLQP